MTNISRSKKTALKDVPQIENGLDFSDMDLCEMSTSEKKTCAYFLGFGLGIGLLIDLLRNF